MGFLKKLFKFVLVLVLALVAGAYLLPREVHVERSVTINAGPEAVFPHVNSLSATQNWSPWLDRDPDVVVNYEGPVSGVGAKMNWQSDEPNVGNGAQEIVASIENERVETALDFGEMGVAKAEFILVPQGDATVVTWSLDTDMGNNPVGRYMGLMMDKWVGGDYEVGLTKLKNLVEG